MIQYLAGIFDSEGYVRIRKIKSGKNYSYTYECRVYMCNKEIVQLFAKQYNICVKSQIRGTNRKTAYYITLNSKELRQTTFINDLLPFLNEKKLQLLAIKNLIQGIDRELCYQDYLLAKKNFTTIIDKEISFEYLAGIIDGDGWLSMHNAGKGFSFFNKYSVGLQQRYKPLIDYMNKFGGSKTHVCKVYDTVSHIQTYSWSNTTSTILPFLENIEPFLIEKKEKCQILINYIKKYEEFRQYSKEILCKW